MLNLHLLECTVKGYDHISDLLLAKYWVITGCKYKGCKSLNSAIIGDGVTLIGYNSFADCNSLASLTIGKNVTTIDHYAFRNCNSLTKMYCYAIKPPTTNGISFPKYEDKAILYVPSGCSSAYKSSNWGSYFRTIVEME